jgi:hypothetical protein
VENNSNAKKNESALVMNEALLLLVICTVSYSLAKLNADFHWFTSFLLYFFCVNITIRMPGVSFLVSNIFGYRLTQTLSYTYIVSLFFIGSDSPMNLGGDKGIFLYLLVITYLIAILFCYFYSKSLPADKK